MLYLTKSFAREHHEYPYYYIFFPIYLLLKTSHAFYQKEKRHVLKKEKSRLVKQKPTRLEAIFYLSYLTQHMYIKLKYWWA